MYSFVVDTSSHFRFETSNQNLSHYSFEERFRTRSTQQFTNITDIYFEMNFFIFSTQVYSNQVWRSKQDWSWVKLQFEEWIFYSGCFGYVFGIEFSGLKHLLNVASKLYHLTQLRFIAKPVDYRKYKFVQYPLKTWHFPTIFY